MDGSRQIGKTIRQLRQEQQISLVAFAKMLGVSRPTVWSWESGRTRPRSKTIVEVACALGVAEGALSGSNHHSVDDRQVSLNDLVEECKLRIAQFAGVDQTNVQIVIAL